MTWHCQKHKIREREWRRENKRNWKNNVHTEEIEFQLIKKDRKRSGGTTFHLLLCAKTWRTKPEFTPPLSFCFYIFSYQQLSEKSFHVYQRKLCNQKERRGKEYTVRVCLIFTMFSQNLSNDEKITEVTPPARQITTFMIICGAGWSCHNSTLN